MISAPLRFAASILVICGSCIATAKTPAKTDSVKARLLSSFGKAGLYQPPEVPDGCLQWRGRPKGDSLLYTASVSRKPACKGVAPVAHQWILSRKGGAPLLVDDQGRTDLHALTGVDIEYQSEGDDLTGRDVGPFGDDMEDVITSGGGGGFRKGETSHRNRQTESGANDAGLGAVKGFGVGDGGTRKPKKALGAENSGKPVPRAQIDPPKPADLELGDDAAARSKESIVRTIRKTVGGFVYTYQKYLKRDPDLGGKLALKFKIAPSGTIVSISIASSQTGNQELDDEIKDKARAMQFDPIESGNVTVTYHLVLRRRSQGGAELSEEQTPVPSRSVYLLEGTDLRTPESILRVLIQNSGGLKYTYQKYLRDQPDLNPKFGVRITIAPSGAVLEASADNSTTGNQEADAELIEKVRNLKFDSIEQGQVKLVYLFDLSK